MGLSADLSKYTDLHIFAKENPDKFFQMGMAEQLLMSAAAGLAREGFVPLRPPMPCLHHAVPMTLFVWQLRKII